MGFLLAGNGLLVVFLTIMAYKKVYFTDLASALCVLHCHLSVSSILRDALMQTTRQFGEHWHAVLDCCASHHCQSM